MRRGSRKLKRITTRKGEKKVCPKKNTTSGKRGHEVRDENWKKRGN